MKNRNLWALPLLLLGASWYSSGALAQTINVSEDFTGTSTTNPWLFFNGACLTASSAAGTGSATTAGTAPGCTSSAIKAYYNENLVGGYNGSSGSSQTLPDTPPNGALRFTNGCINGLLCGSSGGHSQNGAIISGNSYSSSAGIQITFKTTTYRGDSDNGDGADGMSFFLIDGSVTPNIGSFGGSLGYTCSNTNPDYHGMVGAYVGLGIDEYGNFLNAGDNTASGVGFQANRIGMRGAGSIAWSWLSTQQSSGGTSYYPSSTYSGNTSRQNAAVQNTCRNGYLTDYNNNQVSSSKISVYDYLQIPNAYKVLSGVSIANEYLTGGYSRTNATPILYRLNITPAGLLSLSYSVNGGSWQGVLQNQSITASNGPLPSTIRFGFAGSTGGGSNIHEVMCFKAASLDTSGSSAASNLQQSAKVTSTTQAYFAYYNPNDWTGRLTANALQTDSSGNLTIATTAYWDAACVLDGLAAGGTCTATGVTSTTAVPALAPTSRVILSWNGTTGVPFEWSSGISTAQKTTLDLGDSSATANRLNFLRGDRTQETTNTGTGLYRDRDSVLGDIVNSSPAAVGQPVSPYVLAWQDKLASTTAQAENATSAQTYSQFSTAQQTRTNVVYVGANDGLLHGFEAGAYNSSNNFQSATNDGKEVLAYMPAAVVNTIHNATNTALDYANTQYGHNFYVDAAPSSADLFYGGAWHTWLVGGLGAGGAAIYALDVTSPSTFSESNASTLVVGEWGPSNISCSTGGVLCGLSMGNTFGTPLIRRLHNGSWAVIWGNGFGSTTGDAGVYIMTIDPTTAAKTFYYLSTGMVGTGDGIAYVTSVDLDADHIADYLYAGDLLGNVWRFDLTSSTATSWAASSTPVFSAGSSHPITSSLVAAAVATTSGTQVMVSFGTGQQTSLTNTSPTTFASGTQYLYGVWDWNYASWNANSSTKYASLTTTSSNFSSSTGLNSPYTIKPGNLTTQTLALNSTTGAVDITASTICWAGTTTCSGSNKSFGWAAALPTTSEQIIYNPELVGSAVVVNSVIPAANSLLSCTTSLNTGYTYAINLATGGVSTNTTSTTAGTTSNVAQNFFVTSGDANAVAVLTNATGSAFVVTTTNGSSTSTGTTGTSTGTTGTTTTSSGTSVSTCTTNCPKAVYPNPFSNVVGCSTAKTYLVYQTASGTGSSTRVAPQCPLTGQRVTWSQRR